MASESKLYLSFIVEAEYKELITALKYFWTQNDDPFPKGVLPDELENSAMWQIAIGDYVRMKESKWKCYFEFLGSIESRGSVIEIFLTWLRKQPITVMSESNHFATLHPEDGMPEFWFVDDKSSVDYMTRELDKRGINVDDIQKIKNKYGVLISNVERTENSKSYIAERFMSDVRGIQCKSSMCDDECFLFTRRAVREAYYKANNMQYNNDFEGTEFVDNMAYASFLHSLVYYTKGHSLITFLDSFE